MKSTSLINRFKRIACISLILFISYHSYGQVSNNWWSTYSKEYGVDKKDFRVINNIVVLSDLISESTGQTFFDKPTYIAKEKDNLYIYNCDSIIFNKNDSIITLFSGLEVGFSLLNKENKPILISEFDKVINDIKKNTMIFVQEDYGFSWIDRDYFKREYSNIETVKREN